MVPLFCSLLWPILMFLVFLEGLFLTLRKGWIFQEPVGMPLQGITIFTWLQIYRPLPFRYTRLNHKITPCLIGIFGMSNCRSQEPQKKNLREFRPNRSPQQPKNSQRPVSLLTNRKGLHLRSSPSCWELTFLFFDLRLSGGFHEGILAPYWPWQWNVAARWTTPRDA